MKHILFFIQNITHSIDFSFVSLVVLDLKLTCHIDLLYTIIANLLGVITAALSYTVSFDKDYNANVSNLLNIIFHKLSKKYFINVNGLYFLYI